MIVTSPASSRRYELMMLLSPMRWMFGAISMTNPFQPSPTSPSLLKRSRRLGAKWSPPLVLPQVRGDDPKDQTDQPTHQAGRKRLLMRPDFATAMTSAAIPRALRGRTAGGSVVAECTRAGLCPSHTSPSEPTSANSIPEVGPAFAGERTEARDRRGEAGRGERRWHTSGGMSVFVRCYIRLAGFRCSALRRRRLQRTNTGTTGERVWVGTRAWGRVS